MATALGNDISADFVTLETCARCVKILKRVIDEISQAKDVISQLEKCDKLAVDCEGVDLGGKDGSMTYLQISSENGIVYIFDLLKFGEKFFEQGLKRILESDTITKIMFDCRSDSHVLWREFGVRLTNIYDLQLLEYMVRTRNGGRQTMYPPKEAWHSRNPIISGMSGTIKFHVSKARLATFGINDFEKIKKTSGNIMKKDKSIWRHRPARDSLLTYAALDVFLLWELFTTLKRKLPFNGIQGIRLKIGSERYAGARRDVDDVDELFLRTIALQSFIIPELGRDGISIQEFPKADKKCNGCKRLMPKIRKVDDLCLDCGEIKRVADAYSALHKRAK